MATWRDIAMENENAAKQLNRSGLYRSAISRAYYAAYAAVVGHLVFSGAVGERGPSHKALPIMVEGNVRGLRDWQRRDLKAITRRLYEARVPRMLTSLLAHSTPHFPTKVVSASTARSIFFRSAPTWCSPTSPGTRRWPCPTASPLPACLPPSPLWGSFTRKASCWPWPKPTRMPLISTRSIRRCNRAGGAGGVAGRP